MTGDLFLLLHQQFPGVGEQPQRFNGRGRVLRQARSAVGEGAARGGFAADPGFTLLAVDALLVVAALASIPVGVVTYLLDRVVDRIWLSRGGRLAAGAVANALVGGGAGLLLGGLIAPMWRPIERALVFTGPWAIAAAALFVLAAVIERRRAGSAR